MDFLAAPDSPGRGEKYPSWAKKTFTWGYRAMCNFWSSTVFDLPEIAALDYYMRLDDDSRLVCIDADFDPFVEMEKRQFECQQFISLNCLCDMGDVLC